MYKKQAIIGLSIGLLSFGAGALAANISFQDVPPGAWYEQSVNWASNAGLVRGRSEGVFAPDGNVSRAELVTIMQRYDTYIRTGSGRLITGTGAGLR